MRNDLIDCHIDYTTYRAVIEGDKWFLARMNPKKFGDTQKIELSGEVDIAATLAKRLKGVEDEQRRTNGTNIN